MSKALRLSVHQLVDFLLRTGDIDTRVFNRSSMNEGSKIHASYQSKQGKNYISEYPLKRTFVVDEIELTLEGRADGIIKKDSGEYIIDEIKSTVEELEEFKSQNLEWHLGQAKCYALMFAMEVGLDIIEIRMTYIKQGKEKERIVDYYTFTQAELLQYVTSLIEDYLAFYNIIFRQNEARNLSIKGLTFPFDKYRSGQRELAKYAYAVAKNGGRFFCEAPTGIGKTMSTLFPFIKALQLDDKSKIFYLTAKTSGKESAYNAVRLLKENGLAINDIVITAKDKICFCKGKGCNPEECPFAKDYYNKIQGVLKYSLANNSTFDLDTITAIAESNQICPFEFELDLSLFCDIIICDYNYMFDPLSYMKRYFDEDSSHFLALVDEAHNLIDRSRGMYSSDICFDGFYRARKSFRHAKHAKMKREFSKMNKLFEDLFASYDEGDTIVDDFTSEQYKVLNSFILACQDINKNDHKLMTKELLDFYLELNRFVKITEFYSERFMTYIHHENSNISMHINCLDASRFLRRRMDTIKGSVLFSATLSPMDYYIDTLGGDALTDPSLVLPSPFPKKNLEILVAPKVSIKYKNRDSSYREVSEYIKSFIKNKIGNYFIYSPSYEYMENLLKYFQDYDGIIYEQTKDMTDKERELFLLNFQNNPTETTLGFLVIGGAFSEGIDLVSDRLIGAVIVGIGMPRINFESDQIAEYYKKQDKPGHDYAYLNPGMNKIMQAVGRVIRSENDRGAVLLIDERYMNHQYQDLYRIEWNNYKVVFSPEEVEEKLQKFFSK